jgi:hypothetical protein
MPPRRCLVRHCGQLERPDKAQSCSCAMPRSMCVSANPPATSSSTKIRPSSAPRRVAGGSGPDCPSGSWGDHSSGLRTALFCWLSSPPCKFAVAGRGRNTTYGSRSCCRPARAPRMAPKVNKLTPEAQCRADPSRRLNRGLLWRSAHKCGLRGTALSHSRDGGEGLILWLRITPLIKKFEQGDL